MMTHLKSIARHVWNFLGVIFTGGRFGSGVPSPHSYDYSKQQERRRKEFEKFGTHQCKICSTKIPGNKSYCGACYFKYIKK
jgi:hypothetical protein